MGAFYTLLGEYVKKKGYLTVVSGELWKGTLQKDLTGHSFCMWLASWWERDKGGVKLRFI